SFNQRIAGGNEYDIDKMLYQADVNMTYLLSLHDALPIYRSERSCVVVFLRGRRGRTSHRASGALVRTRRDAVQLRRPQRVHGKRSEEHTSELQSPYELVCRLLIEKNKTMAKLTRSHWCIE